MMKQFVFAATCVILFAGAALAQPATSQPTSQPSYTGKPVTAAWVDQKFASRGRYFYRAGKAVLNSIETNFDTSGKPIPLTSRWVHGKGGVVTGEIKFQRMQSTRSGKAP